MNADSKRDASRSEHNPNPKRGSHPHPIHPSNLFLSADVNSPYAAAASALALAAGGGGGGLLRSPSFLGGPGMGPSSPSSPGSNLPGDNSGLMALYQSPLWQAALRQQQLQLISHIASLSNPFLSAQGPPAPPPPQQPPPQMPPFSAASFPSSMEAAHLYRDYLNKYAQAQSNTATNTSNSGRLLTTTSTSSTSSSAQAAALVAKMMAAAGKPTSTSPDFTSSISTTTGMLSGAPDSRGNAVRYGSEKRDSHHSPSSFLSGGGGSAERRDNNNGKHLLSPNSIKSESPPGAPNSVAPMGQSITGPGRGSGQRGSSGRGRGRGGGGAGGGNGQANSTNSADPYNGRDKVFTCKICNRSFGYKHVLQNHERTHTGEKPFECRVCHKRFTRDHHLKTHMRLHTGEKPYNCTHCDRQFVQVANLRRHLRVHTGEKPYKCDICESTFSDSNQLKAHVLIHKGEKPFTCEKCEGKFRRRHHLMHHACTMSKNPGVGITYDEDDDLDSVTSPSSDSIRLDRESDFGFPSKKMRALGSPQFDVELEKKFYRGELAPGSKGPSGLELSVMLAAAARAAAEQANEKRNNSSGISSGSARSRKSRDPKRVRPSADHSPKSDELMDESSDTNSGKILATSTLTSFDSSDIDQHIPREKHFERTFQTEPEDLSSRRQVKREVQDIGEEEEKENLDRLDELDVSTSSDRVSATATVSSTTDPTSLARGPIMNKMPIVNK